MSNTSITGFNPVLNKGIHSWPEWKIISRPWWSKPSCSWCMYHPSCNSNATSRKACGRTNWKSFLYRTHAEMQNWTQFFRCQVSTIGLRPRLCRYAWSRLNFFQWWFAVCLCVFFLWEATELYMLLRNTVRFSWDEFRRVLENYALNGFCLVIKINGMLNIFSLQTTWQSVSVRILISAPLFDYEVITTQRSYLELSCCVEFPDVKAYVCELLY